MNILEEGGSEDDRDFGFSAYYFFITCPSKMLVVPLPDGNRRRETRARRLKGESCEELCIPVDHHEACGCSAYSKSDPRVSQTNM